jgi:hypothetical protein
MPEKTKTPQKSILLNHIKRNKLLDALNRLDDWASGTTADNDNGEAEQQEKDYNLLYKFITKRNLCEQKKN